jgi:hypothetical protein
MQAMIKLIINYISPVVREPRELIGLASVRNAEKVVDDLTGLLVN